jgi:hypothetical protein
MTLALPVLALMPAMLAAQRPTPRSIRGVVRDSSGAAVPYANVVIDNKSRVVADDSGRFSAAADSGRVLNLLVRRIGYAEQRATLAVVSDTTLQITLASAPRTLAAQQIVAASRLRSPENHGFYRRLLQRETGVVAGYFITPEEIEQRRAYRATQVLEGVPGVRMTRMGPSGVFWVALGVDRCPMSIYLDRVRLNSMANRAAPVFIDEIVSPNSLAGIEVYSSAVKAPPEFQPLNGTCGVILLWTK